ncbi:hypothetical protein BBJ29_003636 [Phytophthora kernoviae]|uniref:Ubiquitin-like domain-containing protein n=1 Tax=Phytophthora kernoviae TaxID=325452 RepID=A0A3F2RMJ4_9STRA|nr:hypothetical protein BBJ29_003636 [Phytophthora kernoviae]RLN59544.1 hypothetical protein BBP00_00006436 [Phytophthora kernoviae]
MERSEDDTLSPVSPPAETALPPSIHQSIDDSTVDPSASSSSRNDQEPAAQLEISDNSLHLRLKTLDERVFDVLAASSMSVTDFRAKVALVTDIPAPRQRLIYRGKLLKDGAVLSAYDLQDGHTILDEMNESPQEAAAGMGLGNLPDHLTRNRSGQETPVPPVDLEPITQGIMTMRTVLSTAALGADQQGREEEVDEQELEVETEEIEQQTEETQTTAVQRGHRQFFVGQWLDVKDTVNQWLESTVMDIAGGKVLVHYHGWPTRWDEWIDFDSDRIATFRTRTLHTQSTQRMSPVPTTRVPSAPQVGDNDVRRMVVDVRNLMREMMPHIDRLADLCEDDLRREQMTNQAQSNEAVSVGESSEQTINFDAPNQSTPVVPETRDNEVSEMAHLVAPLFDRFGRLLMDSVRYLDPLLRPELRGTSQRQQERRSTALRYGNGGGFPTFLEVMRRTLSGVRNFVHSDSHDSPVEETSHPVELASSFSLPSSPSSSSSSGPPSPVGYQTNSSMMGRHRVPSESDGSIIEEDLEEVD